MPFPNLCSICFKIRCRFPTEDSERTDPALVSLPPPSLPPDRRCLLLDGVGHEALLGALRAEDVLVVGDEALPDHGSLAGGAEEAVVVPVPPLERDEARPPDACKSGREGGAGIQGLVLVRHAHNVEL